MTTSTPSPTPAGTATLSDEQLAQYRTDGYLVLGRILSDDDLDDLLDEERRFRPVEGFGAATNTKLLVAMQLCDRSEPIRRISTQGVHLGMVAQILGPDVCLTHNQMLTKLPDGDGVHSDIPYHQDSGYGELEPLDSDVTVWVAITDTTLSNGCLHVVPRSHVSGLVAHGAAAANPGLREAAVGEEAVPVELARGEAVAFTGLTLHGSGPNRTDAERIGFYMRYCTPWVRMMSEGGKPVLDDAHSWMVLGSSDRHA